MIPDITVDEPVSLSMNPYNGPWTKAEAAHLLRRTLISPTFAQIQGAVTNGMTSTVNTILTVNTLSQPLAYNTEDVLVLPGMTWVNSTYPPGDTQPTENVRRRSLAAWMMQRLNTSTLSISEKMSLFWQNHFAVEGQFDARSTYYYFKLLHDNCLGNFKQLVKDITINPEMLLFLNGASNNKFSPNENYSRELLELFSIGKGPQIGAGDYTNYTEGDIAAGSKILTGWTVTGLRSTTESTVSAVFNSTLHDTTNKQLSSHFNNVVVASAGAQEYSNYVDIIFGQPACATFICKKIYRYFVNYDITPSVETTVIQEMATTMIANNYDVLPVLDKLFKSEHFYDMAIRGSQIKSPFESFFTMFLTSGSAPSYDLDTNYTMYLNIYYWLATQGENYLAPPSVGGWPAFYQTPSFSKLWLNSTYLKQRFDISIWLTQYGGLVVNGNALRVNALNLLDGLSLPSDAPSVILDLCVLYFPKDITQVEKDNLKDILTNGLPDFEWTLQYGEYQNNPGNATYSDPVRIRMELVLVQIFRMAQYQAV